MASIKNLKKDINYTLGDLIEECYIWELLNPNEDTSKSQEIIDQAISTYDNLLDRVNEKNIENKASHFKSISKDLEEKAKNFVSQINSL